MKKDLCDTSRIGRYGRMRLEFIKQERQELYTQLLFAAGLEEHLIDINERAKERIWDLTQQIAHRQGITEELKARDQMAWVRAMNASKAQAEEIVFHEVVEE
jgi:hypothetical protein